MLRLGRAIIQPIGRALRCLFAPLVLAAPFGATATAQESWIVRPIDGSAFPSEIVAEDRQPAVDGLPDGLVATHDGDIASAWYADPTTRYGHGILGDAVEAATLMVRTRDGETLSLSLPQTEVFEDRAPRLADLDRDGSTEVITIRASVTEGAAVTVYGLSGGSLIRRASTGFIGRANRWLNIAGIADFRANGRQDIAFVRTPHIGGTLFVYALEDGDLVRKAAMDGFSNHLIGATEMRLSAVADVDGDGRQDLAVPSNSRRTLRIIGFAEDGTLTELGSADLRAPIDKAIAVQGSGRDLRFVVGLADGSVHEVRRR